jgi:WD40 repeat protein
MLNAWVNSNFQDESRLLRGQTLQDARNWAADKGLSDLDRRFLDASQELEKRDVQKRLQAEAQASKILAEADAVRSVNFSPDGQNIVTASEDNTVRLWSIDGREIKKFTAPNQIFISATFSPDSKMIAAISANNTVKIWGLDGREIITFQGQDEEEFVSSICFTTVA